MMLSSFSALSSSTGECNVIAVAETSMTDTTPKKIFSHSEPGYTVDDCIQMFRKDVSFLKECGVPTESKIKYVTMEITINKNTIETVEPISASCKSNG